MDTAESGNHQPWGIFRRNGPDLSTECAQHRIEFLYRRRESNDDGLAHALATTILDEAGTYITTVGFEDLLGGGDLDFNDFEFRLTNVIDPVLVAAPPVLALGLLGLSYQRRRNSG